MKNFNAPGAMPFPPDATSFDALLLLIAGAILEVQTRGAVKPFGLQRRTIKALAVRTGR